MIEEIVIIDISSGICPIGRVAAAKIIVRTNIIICDLRDELLEDVKYIANIWDLHRLAEGEKSGWYALKVNYRLRIDFRYA